MVAKNAHPWRTQRRTPRARRRRHLFGRTKHRWIAQAVDAGDPLGAGAIGEAKVPMHRAATAKSAVAARATATDAIAASAAPRRRRGEPARSGCSSLQADGRDSGRVRRRSQRAGARRSPATAPIVGAENRGHVVAGSSEVQHFELPLENSPRWRKAPACIGSIRTPNASHRFALRLRPNPSRARAAQRPPAIVIGEGPRVRWSRPAAILARWSCFEQQLDRRKRPSLRLAREAPASLSLV